jgi:hypothetical protein
MPFAKLPADETPYKAIAPRLGGPLWDLYRDGLTQGSIKLFQRCREQFRLAMVEGWSAKKDSPALEFGNAWHFCDSQLHGSHATPGKTKRCKTPTAAIKRYLEVHKSHVKLSITDREDLMTLLTQVKIVMQHYIEYWKKEDAEKNWVAREQAFTCDYPTVDNNANFREIPIRGRWDGLFYKHRKLGDRLWLHETKTKGRIDEAGLKASLPLDFQTMLYCYAAERRFNESVEGTLYDVIQRPQLRQGKKETVKEFLKRLEKDVESDPRKYFHRWKVKLSKNDIENWRKTQLVPILEEINRWNDLQDKGPYHYASYEALNTAFGHCDLFDLMTTRNTYNLYRRKHIYPELID